MGVGLVWALANPVLALGCSVPLVRTVRGRPVTDALRGLLFGLCWYGPASLWVQPALADYGVDGSWAAWGALTMAQAALLMPVWALAGALRHRAGPFALALAWTALAAPLAEVMPLPLTPAMLVPDWTAPARLGGEALATGCVLAGFAAMASRVGGLALVLLGLLALQPSPTTTPRLRVAVVQPDTGAFDGRRESTADARTERLVRLVQEADAWAPTLIVTPESAWPGLWRGVPEGPLTSLTSPVLLGVHDAADHQAVVAISGGQEVGRTDKILGTPLTERRLGGWGYDSLRPGDGPGYVDVAGLRVGVLMCVEDTSPAALRRVLASDPDLLVIAANDGWNAGDGADWHLIQAQRVAAASGRYVVRAAASGPSAVISPDGILRWTAPQHDGDAGFLPGLEGRADFAPLHPAWTGAGASPYVSAAALLLALGVLACRPRSASG